MSRRGNGWDNAVVESFFATLKTELAVVHHGRLLSQEELRSEIFAYLEGFYNTHRLHSTLGYVSPVEFERRWGAQQSILTRVNGSARRDTPVWIEARSSDVDPR